MNNVLALALDKLAVKDARDRVAPGNHSVDALVRVQGTVKVGEDYLSQPTVSIPLKETLALFIHYCGCTREAAIAALLRAAGESIAATGKGEGSLKEALPVVEETLKVVQTKVLAKLKKQPKKGPVKVKVEIEEVEIVTE